MTAPGIIPQWVVSGNRGAWDQSVYETFCRTVVGLLPDKQGEQSLLSDVFGVRDAESHPNRESQESATLLIVDRFELVPVANSATLLRGRGAFVVVSGVMLFTSFRRRAQKGPRFAVDAGGRRHGGRAGARGRGCDSAWGPTDAPEKKETPG